MEHLLTWQKLTLKLRNPFRLSYGTTDERQAFWIRLKDDAGWGEGTIPPYYHIPSEAMEAFWAQAAEKNEPLPEDPVEIPVWVGNSGPAPARCALDLALHDRLGRLHSLPLYRLLGLPRPEPKPSSFTISIDTPEAMAEMASQVKHYPIIKVKLGGDGHDVARLAAIRMARSDAKLRVDANAGWSLEDALQYLRLMEDFDLELIEQPLEKDDIVGLGKVQAATPIPIVADESVQSMKDIEALAVAGVKGVNLKLMKIGGLSPALAMLKRARELGMRIMLGCMIETSIGTTAMAHLGSFAEWLDLDACALITNDPFEGMTFDEEAVVSIQDRPGIGAIQKVPGENFS
jgi:L-alanine-DL-glutamate epimerase-like enolase superfamily enzyme